MITPIPSIRSDFIGKDSFVWFLGCIEDVNDPKLSHRVKVRCVGWHPKRKKSDGENEDALSTDDLPWARVMMPVTHPQQARIGGKHGLLPGCWVMGFFLDGDEAQDPMVIGTYNFTANANEDDRTESKGKDGKDEDNDNAFDTKVDSEIRNTATRTSREQDKKFGDPADKPGHTYNHDADNPAECGGGEKPLQSAEAQIRQNEKNSSSNPQSQNTNILNGDGKCGTVRHAREDIQMLVQRHMPPGFSRFKFNDAVWNRFSGSYLDLNGILAQLAKIICAELKAPINSFKAFQNDLNRGIKANAIVAIPDRDGLMRLTAEKKLSLFGDKYNAMFQTSIIDLLCSIIFDMLQAIDQQNEGSEGDNESGDTGTGGNSPINNPGHICIADTILDNILTIIIQVDILIRQELEENEDDEGNDFVSEIIGSFGSMLSLVGFANLEKYSTHPLSLNFVGNKSMDQRNKTDQGCRDDRIYNTEEGSTGSIAGIASGLLGAIGGLGSGMNQSGNGNKGFGGMPGDEATGGSSNIVCDDATKTPVRPGDRDFIPCDDDTDCPDGMVCIEGKCYNLPPNGGDTTPGRTGNGTIPCNEDDDCPDGYICVDGFCWNLEDIIGGGIEGGNVWDEPGDFEGINLGADGGGNNFYEPVGFPGINLGASGESNYFFEPRGFLGNAVTVSLPSSEPECAKNFVKGSPNQIVIINPGYGYYWDHPREDKGHFPNIYVKGYKAEPIPVVDRNSGELVAILSACSAYDPNYPAASVTIIPSDNVKGIASDDPAWNITLGGFFISNTGRKYTNPKIEIIDKDNISNRAEVELVVSDGRIVDYEIINSGSGYLRIPRVKITDDTGFKAKLYPIMNLNPMTLDKLLPTPVRAIYCPSNQRNLF